MTSSVSFTVRPPASASRPSSSGPESDGKFKIPALPRHVISAASSATSSPLAGSPRTFSSRDDSDDDGTTGIVFANGPGADDNSVHTDSSDEDNFVPSSKSLGSQRSYQKKKKAPGSEVLVIPTRPNPDWREAARRRRAACSRVQSHISRPAPSFIPDSARAPVGADGSVGGLGTRDTINSGTQLSGLKINKRAKIEVEAEEDAAAMVEMISVEETMTEVIEETEDQKALRAILAGERESASIADIIPVPPISETDALKQDVEQLPDVATADDYERVPVSAFGAAMLRGMGWTEGAVAPKSDKRQKNGLTELYLPQARPALLGIGAKEKEPEDDGSGKKKAKGKDMRYIPIAKRESGRDEYGSSRSGTASRRGSRSPSHKEREDRGLDRERRAYEDRDRGKGGDRDRDRDRHDDGKRRTKEYDERAREKDYRRRDRDQDIDRDRTRDRGGDSYRSRERNYDEPERTRERDRRDRRATGEMFN